MSSLRLTRNAFQNTPAGKVTVIYSSNGLTIRNQNNRSLDDNEKTHGFGIGLIIVERIVEKLGVQYGTTELPNGREVRIEWLDS